MEMDNAESEHLQTQSIRNINLSNNEIRNESESSNTNGTSSPIRIINQNCNNTTIRQMPTEQESNKKRSRIDKDFESLLYCVGNFNLDTALEDLERLVHDFFATQTSVGITTKGKALEILRRVSQEALKLTTKTLVQEEKTNALMQQVVQLQQQTITTSTTSTSTPYLHAALRATNAQDISTGKSLPIPQIPPAATHSPSENIIIIKAQTKGVIPTKQVQEDFRKALRELIGTDLATEICAIRTTRYGGYLVILNNTENRDKVAQLIETNLIDSDRISTPAKKTAKMLCREVPEATTQEEVLRDLYGKHNPEVRKIPLGLRQATIYHTRLGWMFDLSSCEAAAIAAQESKIRFGFGRELRLEEFIPLHQCYRCCNFGHNALACTAEQETCRLCAGKGHIGRECPAKDNKSKWKCHHCIKSNEQKGTNLVTDHAAAQMHRCAFAQTEKDIKRQQLVASGVYTSPQKQINVSSSNNATPTSSSKSNTVTSTFTSRGTNNQQSVFTNATASFISSSSFATKSFLSNTPSSASSIFPNNKNVLQSLPTNKVIKFGEGSDTSTRQNQHRNNNKENENENQNWNNNNEWTQVTRGRRGRGRGRGRGGGRGTQSMTKKGLSRLPSTYEAFWNSNTGYQYCRAVIIAPKELKGYMVTQSSCKDCVVVRFACLQLSFISMYMDINIDVCKSMSRVQEEHQTGRKIIVCADTNAYNTLWGSVGNRQNRLKSYYRRDIIECNLDEMDLCVCNQTPHAPTYIGDTGNKTHIDATFCSSSIRGRLEEWKVTQE